MSAEAQYQRIYERERKARILAEKLLEEIKPRLVRQSAGAAIHVRAVEWRSGAAIAVRKNGVSRSVGRWGDP